MNNLARSVSVSSIPYDASEQQMREIFAQVGPVENFFITFSKLSGKPTGRGVCIYKDPESALSAIRNLNGTECGDANVLTVQPVTPTSATPTRLADRLLKEHQKIVNPLTDIVIEKLKSSVEQAVGKSRIGDPVRVNKQDWEIIEANVNAWANKEGIKLSHGCLLPTDMHGGWAMDITPSF